MRIPYATLPLRSQYFLETHRVVILQFPHIPK